MVVMVMSMRMMMSLSRPSMRIVCAIPLLLFLSSPLGQLRRVVLLTIGGNEKVVGFVFVLIFLEFVWDSARHAVLGLGWDSM